MHAAAREESRIVVLADLEGEYRRARRLTDLQRRVFSRTVAVLNLHKPPGKKLVIVVPVVSPDAVLLGHFANHFDARIVECDSLTSCDCKDGLNDVCDCLREFLGHKLFGPVLIIAPCESARAIADKLMNRLRRKQNVNHAFTDAQPLYVF